jgi:hypothetical protein
VPIIRFYILWFLFFLPFILPLNAAEAANVEHEPARSLFEQREILPLSLQYRDVLYRILQSLSVDENVCAKRSVNSRLTEQHILVDVSPSVPWPPADPCCGFMSLQL